MSGLRSRLFGDVGAGSDRGLGDVICFRWEQRAAEEAVIRMRSMFESLGNPAKFAADVKAIGDEWDHYDHFYRDLTLCDAKAIGQRAQQTVQQMAAAAGQVAPASDPNLDPGLTERAGGALKVAGGLLVAGVVGYGLVKYSKKGRKR